MKKQKVIELVLCDIRSVYNVGAIFRTADAIGVSKIYLVGITPAPIDRFGKIRGDLAKSALGAEKNIKWESVPKISPLLKKFKKEKYQIIALEQSENSKDYKKIKPKEKNVVVLGNEVKGISESVLKKCDVVAEIPMNGKKESLNVSVACGIVLFGVFDN